MGGGKEENCRGKRARADQHGRGRSGRSRFHDHAWRYGNRATHHRRCGRTWEFGQPLMRRTERFRPLCQTDLKEHFVFWDQAPAILLDVSGEGMKCVGLATAFMQSFTSGDAILVLS